MGAFLFRFSLQLDFFVNFFEIKMKLSRPMPIFIRKKIVPKASGTFYWEKNVPEDFGIIVPGKNMSPKASETYFSELIGTKNCRA